MNYELMNMYPDPAKFPKGTKLPASVSFFKASGNSYFGEINISVNGKTKTYTGRLHVMTALFNKVTAEMQAKYAAGTYTMPARY